LNEGITVEEIFGVLPKTIFFIGFIFFGGILGERYIEILDEEVEHVNHLSIDCWAIKSSKTSARML
jgi:hypothetical protein